MVKARSLQPPDRYAENNLTEEVIRIREDLSPEQQRSCLIHELMHSAFMFTGMRSSPLANDEEYIVDCLSSGLSIILFDNPQLKNKLFLD